MAEKSGLEPRTALEAYLFARFRRLVVTNPPRLRRITETLIALELHWREAGLSAPEGWLWLTD